LGFTDALGPGLPDAVAALAAALGAMLAAALGRALGAADAMAAHVPDAISAGNGSLKPIAMTPTVTAVLPSPRSLRTAPPVTLLLPTAAIGTTIRLAALADGEASCEATELSGELAAVPLATGAVVAEGLLHAAKANAVIAPRAPIRPMRRRPGGLAPGALARSVVAARAPVPARAGSPS
jgi:hypothetical protein